MTIKLNDSLLRGFISESEKQTIAPRVAKAMATLLNGDGAGNDFLGWVRYPFTAEEFLPEIEAEADRLRKQSDVVLVAGIGGSYLGARAALEFVKSPLYNPLRDKETPEIYFVGNDLSASHLNEVFRLCEGKDVSAIVISKSGTTTETALAFRLIRDYLEERYGDQSSKRITAITDGAKGGLYNLSVSMGYRRFVIPSDMGGRFSVLSPVGLLPLGVAGIDIGGLLEGAKNAALELCSLEPTTATVVENTCLRYVAYRNILLEKGYELEMFAGYDPAVTQLIGWLKQLFGESEGKEGKGLLPIGVDFTTDLHSLGQYIQQGKRLMLETAITIEKERDPLIIPAGGEVDGLDFLDGKELSAINQTAVKGVSLAHSEGGVPLMELTVLDRSACSLGYLFYFFMFACGVSGYVLGVNPFDQPGVEDYKRNMLALLGREDLADLREQLCKKLTISES